jgi:hypothetical protein
MLVCDKLFIISCLSINGNKLFENNKTLTLELSDIKLFLPSLMFLLNNLTCLPLVQFLKFGYHFCL